jgi:glutamyl-tRNA reductase
MGAYTERLVNEVLQASKKIRTTTELSGGTVSVSFAAVQFVKQHFETVLGKEVLLIGTGKIGANTCKNIVDYLPGTKVTLINRTTQKATELANKYNLSFNDIEHLSSCIDAADIIMVATNSENTIIQKEHFDGNHKKIVIDLSVPCNVSPSVKELKNITLVNVDELSKIKDKTLKKRTTEIPKVKAIIKEHSNAFLEWHEMRKHVPVLKAVKSHLEKMQSGSIEDSLVPALVTNMCDKAAVDKIQKVINGMAVKMRTQNQRGCQYIEAMNDFIATASN